MEFSPTARHWLTVAATLVAAVATVLATEDSIPEWVGVVLACLSTIFAGLGIVPGQVGGTQTGIVNPSLEQPPPIE